MSCEHFRATGAYDAVQGLSTLFAKSSQNQDFDVRWDHALLSVSEMPSDMILEGLCKSKLENYVQLQTVMALYDQETARTKEQKLSQIRDSCKTSYWSHEENSKTSESGAMLWKGDQSPRVKKGKKACVERKVGECFQWKAHGQCS